MTDEIAILRQCRKCREWRSIDVFTPLGLLCRRCVKGKVATGYIGRMRGLALTQKGREAIKEIAAA